MNVEKMPPLWVALFKFARKLVRDEDAAMDLASDCYVCVLESDTLHSNSYWLATLHNDWRDAKRQDARRRHEALAADDDPAIVEYPVTRPSQEIAVEWRNVANVAEQFNEPYPTYLALMAMGYDSAEIADELGVSPKESVWRCNQARRVLRAKLSWERSKKSLHFKGIERRHHRWLAYTRIGGKRINIGRYDTASEAAQAYADYVAKIGAT